MFTTSGTYPWSFVTQIFQNGQPSHSGDRKIFQVMTSTLPKGTLGSVASLLAATLYQRNPDRNHKLWNIVSSERYILQMQVLLKCCYIYMESSQWENWNHLFCCKVSFLTEPHCRLRGVGQGMKQTYLYLWYPLFQAKWDRCDQQSIYYWTLYKKIYFVKISDIKFPLQKYMKPEMVFWNTYIVKSVFERQYLLP